MKKIEIIKSSREYTDIINNSRAKKSKYFSVYYRKNNKSNRYGITVPKKTGPAVTRNKIKRSGFDTNTNISNKFKWNWFIKM